MTKPLFDPAQTEWIRAMASDNPPPLCDYSKLTAKERFALRKRGVPVPFMPHGSKRKLSILPPPDTYFTKLTRHQRWYLREKKGVPVPLLPKGKGKPFVAGAEHPYWKGDAITVKSGRDRARSRYPVIGPCEHCGADKSKVLDRHHKDGNTANNEPENIVVLCRPCHMRVDGRTERLIALRPEALEAHRRKSAARRTK